MDVIEVSLFDVDKEDLNQNYVILDNIEYLPIVDSNNELKNFLSQFDLYEDLYNFFKGKLFISKTISKLLNKLI